MAKNNNSNEANQHDAFFKASLSDLELARDFLRCHLPKKLLAKIDLSTLERVPCQHIDSELRSRFSDIIFKVKTIDGLNEVYIPLEHQSQSDAWLPWRFAGYVYFILDEFRRNNRGKKLPFIYPIIVYNGSKPWHYSTNIFDLFADSRGLAHMFYREPFHLIDLSDIDDANYEGTLASCLTIPMKYIGRDKDSIRAIEEVVNLLDKYGKNISIRLQDIIKSYIMSGIKAHDKEQMLLQVNSLAHKARRYDMVTLGEVLNEELRRIGHEEGLEIGRQEGRQEGKLEILKAIVTRLLTKQTDIATIQDITGATEAEIHQIANAQE